MTQLGFRWITGRPNQVPVSKMCELHTLNVHLLSRSQEFKFPLENTPR